MVRATMIVVAWAAGAVGLLLAIAVGLVFLVGAVSRYQARADASNSVSIRRTQIQTAKQQKQIERIGADIAAIKADGVRRAQRLIDKTLTPLYVQWEAIQAQFAMIASPNNSMVYIPVGANGVPLVSTTPLQKVASGR